MSDLTFKNLVSAQKLADDAYSIDLHAQTVLWSVNGGYIAAALLLAAGDASGRAMPLSISVDYLRPVKAGPASIRVVSIEKTLSTDLLQVELVQGDKVRAIARVWTAEVGGGPTHHVGEMPLAPHPDELKLLQEILRPGEPAVHSFWNVFEQKAINRRNSERRRPRAQFLRWLRYRHDEKPASRFELAARTLPIIDVLGAVAADQMYDHAFLETIAPTVNLTVHFRDTTYVGSWLLCDSLCEHAADGLVSPQVKVWGLEGELLAQGLSQMVARSGAGVYTGSAKD